MPADLRRVRELADAIGAVLAVSAALARYVVELPVGRSRAVLRSMERAPSIRRDRMVLRSVAAGLVARAAGRLVRAAGEVADVAIPEVARQVLARLDLTAIVLEHVDLDRVAAALDVDAVVARVDLDAAVAGVDLDAAVARVDLDSVVRRIDVNGIAAGLDLDTLVDKVDVARIIDQLDLDAIVARVDLDRAVRGVDIAGVIDRVDLDAVVSKVDLDQAVDRVDIDRIVARADIVGIARYVVEQIDLPELIRSSSGSVTAEMVRGVRDQSADADRAVERVVDRLLRRHGRRTDDVPVPAPRTGVDPRRA